MNHICMFRLVTQRLAKLIKKRKWKSNCGSSEDVRVKSGIFGQTVKFGQQLCLFHSSVIGINNKLTKQTVKILMRRLVRSRLIWMFTVCKCVSEFTWCPNLPDFTLVYRQVPVYQDVNDLAFFAIIVALYETVEKIGRQSWKHKGRKSQFCRKTEEYIIERHSGQDINVF